MNSVCIYRIMSSSSSIDFKKESFLLECIDIVWNNELLNTLGLNIDHNYSFECFRLPLTNYEIENYVMHYKAWQEFSKSNFKYCIIIEETTTIWVNQLEIVEYIYSLMEDWDLCFPFDGISRRNLDNNGDSTDRLWYSDAYFINKNAIEKLLNLNTLRKPLEEELITNNNLSIYSNILSFFKYSPNSIERKQKVDLIENILFKSSVWSEKGRQEIIRLLKIFQEICHTMNISVCLGYGTLLGYVRHGSIMTWDDDIDLVINETHFNNLIDRLKESTRINFDVFFYGQTKYIKIWGENGDVINGFDHKFPFIDVWLYSAEGHLLSLENGKFVINTFDYYPLKIVSFEGVEFGIPHNYLAVLDILYSDWRNYINVYMWSHRLERPEFTPIKYKISVDSNGKIIV